MAQNNTHIQEQDLAVGDFDRPRSRVFFRNCGRNVPFSRHVRLRCRSRISPEGLVPLVRQYRPAVEDFTLELPAGLIDPGEQAASSAVRELLEETGFPSRAVHLLGVNKTDAGRLSNRVHSFFIETDARIPGFAPETGVETLLASPPELLNMIMGGLFDAQIALGTLLLADLQGHLRLRGSP
ncbi:NUDIX hydrolase [Bradyrhizobium sp. SZCCHNS3002]|uniref:NUDIX hydrolase n=1 Tax=Bradyrhizobium sp. SZCCHNS3002 TaxID=3057310 RepID=UPI0028F1733B|nr:NUDIX hydrolase [Bradyrhizobium sp. SZCCHNS3002]